MSDSSGHGGIFGRLNPLKWLLSAFRAGGMAEWEELLLDVAAIAFVAVILYAFLFA